jgi:hypothetical protein
LQNYNVSSIIPDYQIIKFHLVVMEELHGNQILPENNGFYANEEINVQMNDTIFILSTQLIYVQNFM